MFDVAILGSGPGGYTTAVKSSERGLKTIIIEKTGNLGGTCLNSGCIPSKFLLRSTNTIQFIKDQYHNFFEIKKESKNKNFFKESYNRIDLLMKKKKKIVNKLQLGIKSILNKFNVKVIHEKGFLIDRNTIITQKTNQIIKSHNIILATGSRPKNILNSFDKNQIISSDSAIDLRSVPKKMVVIGAGPIGLELGSVWNRMGSKITILETLDRIAYGYDQDISILLQNSLEKQGISFQLKTKVKSIKKENGKILLETILNNKKSVIKVDVVLIAIGRNPCTDSINLDKLGIKINSDHKIIVNKNMQTSIKNIYAIGDIVPGPMLAHRASEEGIFISDVLLGKKGYINRKIIPNVIYTNPEVACIGLGEYECLKKEIDFKIGKYPFCFNGRALTYNKEEGFVKIIACKKTDKVIGAQIIGYNASELIFSIISHMEYGASSEDIGRTICPHPTFSETIKEAAFISYKKFNKDF
jgi:dihydrolipoamide dehydrogenase